MHILIFVLIANLENVMIKEMIIDTINYTSNYNSEWINNVCAFPNKISCIVADAIITGKSIPFIEADNDYCIRKKRKNES